MAKDIRTPWLREGKPRRYMNAGFQHLGRSQVVGELDLFLMSRLKPMGKWFRELEFSSIVKYLSNLSLGKERTTQKGT